MKIRNLRIKKFYNIGPWSTSLFRFWVGQLSLGRMVFELVNVIRVDCFFHWEKINSHTFVLKYDKFETQWFTQPRHYWQIKNNNYGNLEIQEEAYPAASTSQIESLLENLPAGKIRKALLEGWIPGEIFRRRIV